MHGLANIGILRAKLTQLPTIAVCVVFTVYHVLTVLLQGFVEELWGVHLT